MPSDTNSGGSSHDPLPMTPEAESAPRSTRSRLVAPLATVAAVALVAAGAGLWFSGGRDGTSGSPPVLHLVDRADRATTLAMPVDGVGAEGAATAYGSRLEVSGTLPDGPDHANVRTFGTGQVPRDRVAALAQALGLPGQPERYGQGWQVHSDNQLLTVSDSPGWRWTLNGAIRALPLPGVRVTKAPATPPANAAPPEKASPPAGSLPTDPAPVPIRTVPTMSCMVIIDGHRACPPATPLPRHGGTLAPGASIPEKPEGGVEGSSGAGSAGNGASSGSAAGHPPAADGSPDGTTSSGPLPKPAPLPATPAAAAIRAAATPMISALGLTHPALTVTTNPGRGQVTADPVVDGLPTSGMSTVLAFDSSAHLRSGSGWLAPSRPGTRYPLASARAVLDARPMPECEPCPGSNTSATVTGAELGLALRWNDHGGPVLVPAWFYHLRGSDRPMVLVAVAPNFLGAPRDLPGKHPGASAGRAGEPGGVVVHPVPPVVGVRPPVSTPSPRATN